MAQAVGGTQQSNEGEEQVEVDIDLRAHLSKYNVPDRVFDLLEKDSITADELSTFRTKDLDNWCDENELRTIEARRFVNAVKALPNAIATQPKVVKVFVGNEEKEQLTQFDEMETKINKLIENVTNINKKKKANMNNIIKEINNTCAKILTFVENLRKNLVQQACITQYEHNQ